MNNYFNPAAVASGYNLPNFEALKALTAAVQGQNEAFVNEAKNNGKGGAGGKSQPSSGLSMAQLTTMLQGNGMGTWTGAPAGAGGGTSYGGMFPLTGMGGAATDTGMFGGGGGGLMF